MVLASCIAFISCPLPTFSCLFSDYTLCVLLMDIRLHRRGSARKRAVATAAEDLRASHPIVLECVLIVKADYFTINTLAGDQGYRKSQQCLQQPQA